MKNIRKEIEELALLGPLPSEDRPDLELMERYEALYRAITRPITDDEARVLIGLFGKDDSFGMAASIRNLIETAPGWPLEDCLRDSDNEWIADLRDRAIRGGRLQPKH